MLTEAREEFVVELRGCNGGLSLMPSSPYTPRRHRFQGGLNYSPMIEIEGRVLAPQSLGGRRIRVWLSQLKSWHFAKHRHPFIGYICDRTGELPGGGLETMLYIPEDAWLPAIGCLAATWRRLDITGAEGNGRDMAIVDFSFSSNALPAT
ncbi:MAG: hypothetical protein EPN98_04210 [Phenylobacterium sp.]|uniref:hypothetical protein n=1 Tax=Phenylobacterium sp. TaxID=1871053 RepID=UPI001227257D|nr:hypothetical protein [Phenylobacterium sp.]TAL36896.1 MAG: hypothetical protein EPN98_04210 [Phenylobacterium sp.]